MKHQKILLLFILIGYYAYVSPLRADETMTVRIREENIILRSDQTYSNSTSDESCNVTSDRTWFEYNEITGIGFEEGVTRRDPSDVIKVGSTYYVWYTKIPAMINGKKTPLYNSGYYGTIWYAASSDGFSWDEQGMALGPGDEGAFDSYRVDDAALLVKDQKIWLYYKGRRKAHGREGPERTMMGVAIADRIEGPYKKFNNPILDKSHENLIWNSDGGVKALASFSKTIEFAADGLDFYARSINLPVENIPVAPGLYRPHLTNHSQKDIAGWGISMQRKGRDAYLIRFQMKQ